MLCVRFFIGLIRTNGKFQPSIEIRSLQIWRFFSCHRMGMVVLSVMMVVVVALLCVIHHAEHGRCYGFFFPVTECKYVRQRWNTARVLSYGKHSKLNRLPQTMAEQFIHIYYRRMKFRKFCILLSSHDIQTIQTRLELGEHLHNNNDKRKKKKKKKKKSEAGEEELGSLKALQIHMHILHPNVLAVFIENTVYGQEWMGMATKSREIREFSLLTIHCIPLAMVGIWHIL